MKLYYDPASTVCRGIMLFAAEASLDLELEYINLFADQNKEPGFDQINPNQTVPALVDGDLRLTESSAILKYLADSVGSSAYPSNLRERARINAAMDWFNTGFYHEYGYQVVYSQVLPKYALSDLTARAEVIANGCERAARRLSVLNDHMLGDNAYVCGPRISLAEYFGLPIVALGELVGFDLSPWPNVAGWVATMKSRPAWPAVDVAFQGMKAAVATQLAAQVGPAVAA